MEFNNKTILSIGNIDYTSKEVNLINDSLSSLVINSIHYNESGYADLGAVAIAYFDIITQYESYIIIDSPGNSHNITLLNDSNYIIHALFFPIWNNKNSHIVHDTDIVIFHNILYQNQTGSDVNMLNNEDPHLDGGLTIYSFNRAELYLKNISCSDLQVDLHKDIYKYSATLDLISTETPYVIKIKGGGTMPANRFNNKIKIDGSIIFSYSGNISQNNYFLNNITLDKTPHIISYEFDAIDENGDTIHYNKDESITMTSPIIAAYSSIPETNIPNKIKFTSLSVGSNLIYEWLIQGIPGLINNTSQTFLYEFPKVESQYDVTLNITDSITNQTDSITYTIPVNILPEIPACNTLYNDEYYTTSCHMFTSTEDSNISVKRILKLYNYLNEEIGSYDIDIDQTKVKFSVEKDGVYIAKIYIYSEPLKESNLLKEFPVYTFCKAEECIYNLTMDLMCTDNSCEGFCDILDKEDAENKRHALTRLNTTLSLINKMVYLERNKYLGMTIIDDKRSNYINNVIKLTQVLETFVNRCKDCFDFEKKEISKC